MKMLFKRLIVAFFYAAILAGASTKAQETIKIGVSVPSADHGWTGGIVFFAQETKVRLEALYKHVQIIVKTATGPADQAKGLEDLVATERIDALVILPYESGPLTDPVRAVKKQGVFVTVVDRALTDDSIQDLYVAGDNPGMGKIAAQYVIDRLGGKGQIVVLRGLPTVIDNQRFDTFMELVKNTQITVLDSKYANWNQNDGFKVMQDFLTRFPKIDAVWAQDDDIALGVLDALRKAKREKGLFVVGGGGMKEMIKRVQNKDALGPGRHCVFAEHDRRRDRAHGASLYREAAGQRDLHSGLSAGHAGKRGSVLFSGFAVLRKPSGAFAGLPAHHQAHDLVRVGFGGAFFTDL